MKKLIFLNDINFDDSPVVRSSEREEVVHHYADCYKAKRPMPPITLFWDKDEKKMYLADGKHRCSAVEMIGRKAIEADVRSGTYQDALQFALTANSEHGLPRSNADKRQCIIMALKQWPKHTNNRLSELCDVDDKTVAAVRESLEANQVIEPSPVRESSSGKQVPANVVRKSEPAPKAKAAEVKVVDALGMEIPKAIQKYWGRSEEVKQLLHGLSDVAGTLKKAQRDKDVLYAEVNFTATISDVEKAYFSLKCASPYAVCTQCQGHPETQKGGCRLCMGRGLISKFRYERLVPEEVKKIREKK